MKELSSYGNFRFYFVGNNEDQSLRSELIKNKIIYLFVSSMDRVNLLKLISVSDLFITTNSNIMHLAGTTDTPQISLFGEFNPFKWAPIGKNKEFINKSDFVNAVETDDVLSKAKKMLKLGT